MICLYPFHRLLCGTLPGGKGNFISWLLMRHHRQGWQPGCKGNIGLRQGELDVHVLYLMLPTVCTFCIGICSHHRGKSEVGSASNKLWTLCHGQNSFRVSTYFHIIPTRSFTSSLYLSRLTCKFVIVSPTSKQEKTQMFWTALGVRVLIN